MKKFLICVLAAIFLCVGATPTYAAANPPTVMPMFDYFADIRTGIAFQTNMGIAYICAEKNPTINWMEGIITVYEYVDNEWSYVDSCVSNTLDASLYMELEFDGVSGVEYKMDYVITAYYGNRIMEEITGTEYATCP